MFSKRREVFGKETDGQIVSLVDDASRITDEEIEKRVQPMISSMREATTKLIEQKGGSKEDIEHATKEEDSPFFEGYSGLRSFFGQGLRKGAEELYQKNNMGWFQRGMRKTWFTHGKYTELPERVEGLPFKRVVGLLARNKRDRPLNIYREEARVTYPFVLQSNEIGLIHSHPSKKSYPSNADVKVLSQMSWRRQARGWVFVIIGTDGLRVWRGRKGVSIDTDRELYDLVRQGTIMEKKYSKITGKTARALKHLGHLKLPKGVNYV